MITQEARPARVPALIRLARALRAMHREQVYAMECLLRLSQPPEADPLTWIRTRSEGSRTFGVTAELGQVRTKDRDRGRDVHQQAGGPAVQ